MSEDYHQNGQFVPEQGYGGHPRALRGIMEMEAKLDAWLLKNEVGCRNRRETDNERQQRSKIAKRGNTK